MAALTLPPIAGPVGPGVKGDKVVEEEKDCDGREAMDVGGDKTRSLSARIEWLNCWRYFNDGATRCADVRLG
jgi:hypothetical protein